MSYTQEKEKMEMDELTKSESRCKISPKRKEPGFKLAPKCACLSSFGIIVINTVITILIVFVANKYTVRSDENSSAQPETFIQNLRKGCNSTEGIDEYQDNTRKNCINNLSALVQLLKNTSIQSLLENHNEITKVRSMIEELKYDVNMFANAVYNLDATSNGTTERNISHSSDDRSDAILRARVTQNNRLINKVLHRKRSVLQLSGTAESDQIHWYQEVRDGNITFDKNGIYIYGGGTYLLYSNIHFSKHNCDGTERFGYHVTHEYCPGEYRLVAYTGKRCLTGTSIDEGLFVQTVITTGFRRSSTIKVQYDSRNHKYISKAHSVNTFGIIEI